MKITINNEETRTKNIQAGSVISDSENNYFLVIWDAENESYGLVNLFNGEYLPHETFETISDLQGENYILVDAILNISRK